MRKAICAGTILLLLFATALLNTRQVDRLTTSLLEQIQLARIHADKGDFDAAASQIRQTLKSWESKAKYSHIMLSHGAINEITDAFWELLSDLHAQDAGSAKGSFGILRNRLDTLAQMERIRIGSVF